VLSKEEGGCVLMAGGGKSQSYVVDTGRLYNGIES